jgi:tetratricopeptide (TPR) repeat protein
MVDHSEEDEPAAIKVGAQSDWPAGLAAILPTLPQGTVATLTLGPSQAYGDRGSADLHIPPGATLKYHVAILGIKKKSLVDALFPALAKHDLSAALQQFRSLKQRGFPEVYAGSAQLNYLGYGVLYALHDFDGAQALMKTNVSLFPNRGDLYDSLAESYFVGGDEGDALHAYERAVEKDASLETSKKMVELIRAGSDRAKARERLLLQLKNAGAFTGPFSTVPVDTSYLVDISKAYFAQYDGSTGQDGTSDDVILDLLETLLIQYATPEQIAHLSSSEASLPRSMRLLMRKINEVERQTRIAEADTVLKLSQPLSVFGSTLSNKQWTLQSHRGKILLVVFWTSESPQTRLALPHIMQVFREYQDRGLEIVGVCLDMHPPANAKVGFDSLFDGEGPQGPLVSQFGIRSVPSVVLIDRRGKFGAILEGPDVTRFLANIVKDLL